MAGAISIPRPRAITVPSIRIPSVAVSSSLTPFDIAERERARILARQETDPLSELRSEAALRASMGNRVRAIQRRYDEVFKRLGPVRSLEDATRVALALGTVANEFAGEDEAVQSATGLDRIRRMLRENPDEFILRIAGNAGISTEEIIDIPRAIPLERATEEPGLGATERVRETPTDSQAEPSSAGVQPLQNEMLVRAARNILAERGFTPEQAEAMIGSATEIVGPEGGRGLSIPNAAARTSPPQVSSPEVSPQAMAAPARKTAQRKGAAPVSLGPPAERPPEEPRPPEVPSGELPVDRLTVTVGEPTPTPTALVPPPSLSLQLSESPSATPPPRVSPSDTVPGSGVEGPRPVEEPIEFRPEVRRRFRIESEPAVVRRRPVAGTFSVPTTGELSVMLAQAEAKAKEIRSDSDLLRRGVGEIFRAATPFRRALSDGNLASAIVYLDNIMSVSDVYSGVLDAPENIEDAASVYVQALAEEFGDISPEEYVQSIENVFVNDALKMRGVSLDEALSVSAGKVLDGVGRINRIAESRDLGFRLDEDAIAQELENVAREVISGHRELGRERIRQIQEEAAARARGRVNVVGTSRGRSRSPDEISDDEAIVADRVIRGILSTDLPPLEAIERDPELSGYYDLLPRRVKIAILNSVNRIRLAESQRVEEEARTQEEERRREAAIMGERLRGSPLSSEDRPDIGPRTPSMRIR